MITQLTDLCVHCGESTALGSGKFVNRLGWDEGWSCASCAGYECDMCDKQIAIDEDVSDEFEFGHYHTWCRTPDKWDEASREWFEGLELSEQISLLTAPAEEQ